MVFWERNMNLVGRRLATDSDRLAAQKISSSLVRVSKAHTPLEIQHLLPLNLLLLHRTRNLFVCDVSDQGKDQSISVRYRYYSVSDR